MNNSESKILICNSLQELGRVADEILDFGTGCNLFAFHGNLGAGKTTLVKEICRKLGVDEEITSPTFTLVNEYVTHGETIYHFDFYRINSETEVYDMGYEEYFYSGNKCFIEWPEKIEGLLPEKEMLKIEITSLESGTREITLTRF